MTDQTPSRPFARLVALVLVCGLLAGLLVAPPASAGDNVTIFTFDPGEVDADAGDTVELELAVSSHGDYAGDGIDELSVELAYDADVFDVTEIEHGPMLAAGDDGAEVDGTAEIDDANGTVRVAQERVPAGDGAIATETAATITLEVAADAPQATETLRIADASATLVSDYPQATIERDAEIRIDGGAPDDGDDGDEDDDPDGVTLADGSSADGTDDAADSIPGFEAAATLVALATLAGSLARRLRG